MTHTPIGRLRLVGIAEGISFLILLGIAMPLKYVWGQPLAVRIVGLIHGPAVSLVLRRVAQRKKTRLAGT